PRPGGPTEDEEPYPLPPSFLVDLHGIEQVGPGAVAVGDRQSHRSKNPPMPIDEVRPQPPGTLRELGGVHHPNRDRLTVADQVVLYLLDRMAEGVAIVEHFAADTGLCRQRLAQVGRHDRGFNPDSAFHKLTSMRPALAAGGRRSLLH